MDLGGTRKQGSGEDYVKRSFMLSTPFSHRGDQLKKNEMDRARSTCGGEKRCIQGFGGKT